MWYLAVLVTTITTSKIVFLQISVIFRFFCEIQVSAHTENNYSLAVISHTKMQSIYLKKKRSTINHRGAVFGENHHFRELFYENNFTKVRKYPRQDTLSRFFFFLSAKNVQKYTWALWIFHFLLISPHALKSDCLSLVFPNGTIFF